MKSPASSKLMRPGTWVVSVISLPPNPTSLAPPPFLNVIFILSYYSQQLYLHFKYFAVIKSNFKSQGMTKQLVRLIWPCVGQMRCQPLQPKKEGLRTDNSFHSEFMSKMVGGKMSYRCDHWGNCYELGNHTKFYLVCCCVLGTCQHLKCFTSFKFFNNLSNLCVLGSWGPEKLCAHSYLINVRAWMHESFESQESN